MTRLLVNGCSYMQCYAAGNGHVDLAKQLNINSAISLALPGSCNSRIIRTTLKDSYQTSEKTLYIVGLTFLGRTELPIAYEEDLFEGKWLSIQNNFNPALHYNDCWTVDDSTNFIKLKLKAELYGIDDYLEQLMYQLLSMRNDLIGRGHSVIIFRNPEDGYDDRLSTPRFTQLAQCVNIVHGLKWAAIPWQTTQAVKFKYEDMHLPAGCRHPMPGEHASLTNYLIKYINKHDIYLPVL
jgi:hypothetical protein